MKKQPSDLIRLQHEEVELFEACGIPCTSFQVCLTTEEPVAVGLLYLKLDDTWHRFFLDVWLLFWREDEEPDWEDELLEGEMWVDWGKQLGVEGVALSEVSMGDCVLTLRFENGASVVLKHTVDDLTSILRFVPGP